MLQVFPDGYCLYDSIKFSFGLGYFFYGLENIYEPIRAFSEANLDLR